MESAPDTVKSDQMSPEMRLKVKSNIDVRLLEIETVATKITRALDIFKKLINPNSEGLKYSSLDFLIDISEELSTKLPVKSEKFWMIESDLTIPVDELPPLCQKIKTRVLISNGESNEDADHLVYQVAVCGGVKNFKDLLVVEFAEDGLEFKVATETWNYLTNLFAGVAADKIGRFVDKEMTEAGCSFATGTTQSSESIKCKNILVKISKDENVVFNTLGIHSNGNVSIEAEIEIYEAGALKATASLITHRNGEIKFNLDKKEK